MKKNLFAEWDNILTMKKSTPYVFRTRLERTINLTLKHSRENGNKDLFDMANKMLEKLQYISDQSNQTSDGCLNSFLVLEDDMLALRDKLA